MLKVYTNTVLSIPWPFIQYGLDLLSHLASTIKFVVVATDYFLKWVEVEPFVSIMDKGVKCFIWKNIICHFGLS